MFDIERNPFLAPLRLLKPPYHKRVLQILGVLLFVWMQVGFPAGWVYDLGGGTGTEQGQMPDSSVQVVRAQDELEDLRFWDVPVTVPKKDLIQCPLLHLRDPGVAGSFTNSKKMTHEISEYLFMDYPIGLMGKWRPWLGATYYNTYYLAPLEDGSYLCVYFDDYLTLLPGDRLHTGRVRYTTPEERTMLHGMAKHYAVKPEYILDMYRPEKCSLMAETTVRLIGTILATVGVWAVMERRKKGKKRTEEGTKNQPGSEKFVLQEGELILGSVTMHSMSMRMNGTIYVTDQRVCFKGNVLEYLYAELPLSRIAGYSTERVLLAPSVTIYDRYEPKNTRYRYTGVFAKTLQQLLEQAGIQRIK